MRSQHLSCAYFHVKLGSLCQKHLPQVIAWLIDTVLRGWGKRVDYRGCYEGLLYLNWEQALVAWCLCHGGCKDLMHAACCVRSMIGIFDILPLILCYYDNMLRARHETRHSWNELKFVPKPLQQKSIKRIQQRFSKAWNQNQREWLPIFLLQNWGWYILQSRISPCAEVGRINLEAFGPSIPCCCA